jgi:VCBS repeat-containing protein
LRCIPQIHGGVLDALKPTRATLEIEINSVTDNPLIFSGDNDEEAVLSGGNFHGHPLALACDAAKIAVASLGTISERRINILVDGEDRGLPPCLVAEPGVNSGYMIAHYMSAGLVTENRVLAHPSSVDSIPVSGGIEDVNTMGATAARHYRQIVANVETVLASPVAKTAAVTEASADPAVAAVHDNLKIFSDTGEAHRGNLLENDGSDNDTLVLRRFGDESVGKHGLTLTGDYGVIHVDREGNYAYTLDETKLPDDHSGHVSESFKYGIDDGTSHHSDADTLTVYIHMDNLLG